MLPTTGPHWYQTIVLQYQISARVLFLFTLGDFPLVSSSRCLRPSQQAATPSACSLASPVQLYATYLLTPLSYRLAFFQQSEPELVWIRGTSASCPRILTEVCRSLQLWDKPKENPSNVIFEVKKTGSVLQLKQGLTRSCTVLCCYAEIWCTYIVFLLICEKNGFHRRKIYDDHGSLNRSPHALVTETDEVPVQLSSPKDRKKFPSASCRNWCRLSSTAVVSPVLQWRVAASLMRGALLLPWPRLCPSQRQTGRVLSHSLLQQTLAQESTLPYCTKLHPTGCSISVISLFRKAVISSEEFLSLWEGLVQFFTTFFFKSSRCSSEAFLFYYFYFTHQKLL